MSFKPSFMKNAKDHLNDARIDADVAWKTLQHTYPAIRNLEHPLKHIEQMASEHPEKISKQTAREMALSLHHLRRSAELLKINVERVEKRLK